LFSVNQYAINTISNPNDFLATINPDIATLKTLYEDGEKIIDNLDTANL
jgi:hypothetical protein